MTRVLEVMALSTGGVGRHVSALVGALDGDELTLDIAGPSATTTPMPKPLIPLEIPKELGRAALHARRSLGTIVEAGGYQVVHAHGLRAGLTALHGSAGRPVIVTLHNLVLPATSGRLRSVLHRQGETAILRKARTVFVVSEEMASVLGRRVPEQAAKLHVLPIGIPAPEAKRGAAEVRRELDASQRPLVVTVARLAPQKALDVLLRALTHVPSALLAIIGNGRLETELKALAKDLGIGDRVLFLGWREQVGDYLHAADVFALSSTWEARALAVQEAILADLPVVATDVGGIPELIKDGISGRLVPPSDPEQLGAAIAEVIGSPDVARSYAQQAKRDLSAGYSEAAMLERVRSKYVELARA